MPPVYIRNSWLWHYLQTFVWSLLFLTAVALWLFIKRLPAWFRTVRGASWPIAEGSIESTTVSAFAEQSLAQIAYSYRVEGERYSGYYARQFADEQDAWDYIGSLKQQPIFVRYRPADPAISAVRMADQSSGLMRADGNFVVQFLTRSLVHVLGLSYREFRILRGVQNWPVTKARIESGIVTQQRKSAFWYLVPSYLCEVGYSYSVGGEYCAGHFQRTFFREQTARKFTGELKGKDVIVRYQPDSPSVSVLRRRDQHEVHSA